MAKGNWGVWLGALAVALAACGGGEKPAGGAAKTEPAASAPAQPAEEKAAPAAAAAPAAPTAPAGKPGDAVVDKNGVRVTREELEARLFDGGGLHELDRTSEGEYFEAQYGAMVRERLVLKKLGGTGYLKKMEPELDLIRRRYLALQYAVDGVAKRIEIPEAEVSSRMPKKWVKVKFRELTYEDRAAADRARAVLDKEPGKILELIRTESVGPMAEWDGVTKWLEPRPFNVYFDAEDDDHLFSLPVGGISRVVETKIGYHIFQAMERQEVPAAEVEKKAASIRSGLREERVREKLDAWLAEAGVWSLAEADEKAFYRLVLDWKEKGALSEEPAARVGGHTVSFRSLVRYEAFFLKPRGDKRPVAEQQRLKGFVRDTLAPDLVLSDKALADTAFALSDANTRHARADRERYILTDFWAQLVDPASKVTDAEVEAYYQKREADYFEPLEAKVKAVVSADEAAVQDLSGLLLSVGDFEWVRRTANERGVNRAPNGGDLGLATKKQLGDTVGPVVFALRPGKHTPVIKTAQGYAIYFLEGYGKTRRQELAEVKDAIRAGLSAEKRKTFLKEFFGPELDEVLAATDPAIKAEAVERLKKLRAERMTRTRDLTRMPHGHGG